MRETYSIFLKNLTPLIDFQVRRFLRTRPPSLLDYDDYLNSCYLAIFNFIVKHGIVKALDTKAIFWQQRCYWTCVNLYRKEQNRTPQYGFTELDLNKAPSVPAADAALCFEDLKRTIRLIDPEYGSDIIHIALEGGTVKKVAHRQGLSQSHTSRVLSRSRAKLVTALQEMLR